MKYFKKIIGEKCYLSPINADDVEKYTEWINDMEMTVFMSLVGNIISLTKEREILEELAKKGCNFAIVEVENDKLLGNCGLFSFDNINRSAELGIFIGDRDKRNKGYGEEAVKLLLNFGFRILNLHNIILDVYSYNKRGIRCYEKCGFKEIGRRRESKIMGGEFFDIVYMDILSTEFKENIFQIYIEK